MKLSIRIGCAAVCALAISAASAQTKPADPNIPHLEKRGSAVQMIVDGKPFLALSGELANTSSSDLETMKGVWPMLANKMHLTTVLTGMSWSWVEPQEGKYDFTIADAAIESARRNNLHIAWLWFASWKNGLSSFVPGWAKANQERFPRAQVRDGKSVEVLSTLSENNWQADARAFAALMRHVRETDKTHRVIMVQIENEVGLLGDSRDRSPLAEAAFAKPVPSEFTDYLQKHKDTLLPEFRKVWESAGFKTSGTWEEVFGKGAKAADEIFMGWNYSRYIDHVAEAGKKEYPIPMYVNAWIVQPEDKGPGDYPSGGPQDHMHDIWRAGAPHIDLLCPDIYLPDFTGLTARYSRSGNPLFIPESSGDIKGAANAFYAIGHHNAIGYSSMGIDSVARMQGAGPGSTGPVPPPPPDIEALPLPMAYQALGQLAPLILEHQSKGTIGAVWLNKDHPDTQVKLGDYILNVGLTRNRRAMTVVPDVTGYGIFMATGPDEYYLAGNNLQVTFTPATPGPPIAGLAQQEAGRFENGKWVVTRYLAGDDSVLRYDIDVAAAMNQSASGVRLTAGARGIQRVKLYRYK
jgi:hypothetical protein